jgi:hypothetical protein
MNKFIGTLFHVELDKMLIQTKPSINCWTANKKGMAAKNCCDGFFTYFKPAMPTAVSTVKDAKLAVVEKHMVKLNFKET